MPKESLTVNTPQIKRWRKRMKRFHLLKKEISLLLLKKGFNREMAQVWLRTPHEDLGGKAPRDFLNPVNISRLYAWVQKHLA